MLIMEQQDLFDRRMLVIGQQPHVFVFSACGTLAKCGLSCTEVVQVAGSRGHVLHEVCEVDRPKQTADDIEIAVTRFQSAQCEVMLQ
ncbi:hypothetical protein CFB84_43670 [Burkholderia aenigmatica]|uniref:Uncharacterized protein n=1 Tax=Burkholderia aenigmatica TaxID=2015348 RepID=A0A228HHP1_9BURK|nr:hypothetical protein CFB84_43670 [Burkholderia aenigmatica]